MHSCCYFNYQCIIDVIFTLAVELILYDGVVFDGSVEHWLGHVAEHNLKHSVYRLQALAWCPIDR